MKNKISTLLYLFIFLFPFFFLSFFNYIENVTYFSFYNDATASYYAMGVSWLAGIYPKLYFHQPAFFFQELSAIMVILTGWPDVNLNSFNTIGILINLFFISIVGIWVSFISRMYSIGLLNVLIIGFLISSFPITTLCISIWSFNIPVIMLLVPISIIFFYEQNNVSIHSKISYFILGFIIANYFLGLVILISIIVRYIIKRKILSPLFFDLKKWKTYIYITFPLFLLSITWTYVGTIDAEYQQIRVIIISFICIFLLLYFVLIYFLVKKYELDFLSYLMIGWCIGVNLFAVPWFISLYVSFFSTGGTSIIINESYNTYLVLSNFFLLNPWHWFLIIIPLFSLILIFDKMNYKSNIICLIFPFIILFLNAYLVKNVILNIDYEYFNEFRNYGLISRYFIISLVPLIYLYLFFCSKHILINYFINLLVLFLCIYTLITYKNNLTDHISAVNSDLKDLNNYISNHLSDNEINEVYYVSTIYPEKASTLYALNTYRREQSKNILFINSLDKRQIYIPNIKDLNFENYSNEAIFVHEHTDSKDLVKLMEFNKINIYISKKNN
jgi:hypothetical protein